MNYLSVCSGIEAATVAWHPLGWEAQAFSEIEPFPCAVLSHHYPGVPNWGDMTKFKEWPDANVNVLVGGTPCQSFSVAGLRKGLDDPRGNLMLTYLAIADKFRPSWLVWENVPGVLSSNGGRDFATFLRGLAELGYGFAYRILDAQYFGVPQRRRRVFVVGCLGDWRRAAAVLFEQHSLQGHTAPRRKAGEVIAPTVTRGIGSGGTVGQDEGMMPVSTAWMLRTVAPCLDAMMDKKWGSNQWVDSGQFVFCASDGQKNATICENLAPTLVKQSEQPYVTQPIAFGWQNSSQQGASASASASHTPTLDKSKVPAIAWSEELTPSIECAGTIQYGGQGGRHDGVMLPSLRVRRLTPTECERLQGFPDNYTRVPYRGKQAADGLRYKALGNSMAVPVMRWIGERISAVDAIARGAA